MITIYYNGLALKDCVVKRFQQEAVRDASQTDVIFQQFTITVESTTVEQGYMDLDIGPQYGRNSFNFVPMGGSTGNPLANTLRQMQDLLTQNRRDFWMMLGGQTTGDPAEDYEKPIIVAAGSLTDSDDNNTMPSNPRTGSGSIQRFQVIDVENGPHVEDVAVEQIFGGKAARVSATFKVSVVPCGEGSYENISPNPDDQWLRPDANNGVILSNCWGITESKDQNWVTSRVIEGEIRTRHHTYFAQNYRDMVLPPLYAGYRRMSQRFTTNKAGTVMKYVIEDKQEYAAPPRPAVSWNATHTESTTNNGAVQIANFNIKLTGGQDVDKQKLIDAAGQVLTLRIKDIQNSGDNNNNYTVLTEMAVIDQLDQPTIEMRASVKYTTAEPTFLSARIKSMTGGRGGNLVTTRTNQGIPEYDPYVWQTPLAYDSSQPISLLQCYLQEPCTKYHGMVGEQRYPEAPWQTSGYRKENLPSLQKADTLVATLEDLKNDNPTWNKPSLNSQGGVNEQKEKKNDIYYYPYTMYQYATTYDQSRGMMHLPISSYDSGGGSPNDPKPITAVALKMNSGVTRVTFEISATRNGYYPLVPQFLEERALPSGSKMYLLDQQLTLRPPEIGADGNTKAYGLALRLVYGVERSISSDEEINPGGNPIDRNAAAQNSFQLSQIMDDTGKLAIAATEEA